MNRSKSEALTDEVIGEAVLSLLKSNGPITTQSLLNALQAMASTETQESRREMIALVIAEISNNTGEDNDDRYSQPSDPDRKNVFTLFDGRTGRTRHSGKKMH